jgi:hypothetical protein
MEDRKQNHQENGNTKPFMRKHFIRFVRFGKLVVILFSCSRKRRREMRRDIFISRVRDFRFGVYVFLFTFS